MDAGVAAGRTLQRHETHLVLTLRKHAWDGKHVKNKNGLER
jgi:hypothetical protein